MGNSDSNSLALLEDLGLAQLSQRGRRKAPLAVEYVRDLTAADMDRVANGELPAVAEGLHLRALATKHHTLAQLLASGEKQANAAIAVGMTPVAVNGLVSDPQFAELVEYYRGQGEAKYLNVHERLGALGMAAVDELQYRLEHKPDALTTREVREILDSAMDRSIAPTKKGAGAGSAAAAGNAPVQVNITFPGAGAPVAPQVEMKTVTGTVMEDEP